MPTDDIFNVILLSFQNAAAAYYPGLVVWATRILTATTCLGGALLMWRTARAGNLRRMTDILIAGLILIGVVYLVLVHSWDWGNGLLDLSSMIGQQVGGFSRSTMTPSGVYNEGMTTVGVLYHARTFMSWMHPLNDGSFIVVSFLTWVTWGAAAIIYLFTQIQARYMIAIGPIKLAFATLEYTEAMLYVWIEALLAITIKLMATYLTWAIDLFLANGWADHFVGLGIRINSSQTFYAFEALGQAVFVAASLGVLPYLAHRLVKVQMGGGMTWSDAGAWSLLNAGKKAAGTAYRTGKFMASFAG